MQHRRRLLRPGDPGPSERLLDAALGFAAGVMLSASCTSLILPGIEAGGRFGVYQVLAGVVLGAAVLDSADRWVPKMHTVVLGRRGFEGTGDDDGPGENVADDVGRRRDAGNVDSENVAADVEKGAVADNDPTGSNLHLDDPRFRSVVVFVVAITLHNHPEGLAVGVAFGSGDPAAGLALAVAIGLQNVPEGLAVAVAAVSAGIGRTTTAALAGIRAGLVELPVAVFGGLAVALAAPLVPYAMGFAAGGMLFVIVNEIVPETHVRGHGRVASAGTIVGIIVMLSLDVILA